MNTFKSFLSIEQKWPPHGAIIFLMIFVLVGLQNSFTELFSPTLSDEDGSISFTVFFNEHELKSIFTYHNGYIALLPMILGYVIHFFPLTVIPYIYVAVALTIKSLSCFLLYKVIGRIFRSESLAWYILLTVSIFPFSAHEFSVSLQHQIWNFLLILFLLLFLPIPNKAAFRIPYIFAVILLIFSNPSSVLLAPIYVFRLLKEKAHRIEYALFIFIIGIFVLFGIEPKSPSFSGLQHFVGIFSDRVVIDSLLGLGARLYMQYLEITGWLAVCVLGVIFFRLFLSWKDIAYEEKEFIVILCYMAVFMVLVSLIGRPNFSWKFYYHMGGGIRYIYISRILMAVLILVALFYMLQNFAHFHGIFLGTLLIFLYIQSGSFIFYKTNIEESERVAEFIHILSQKNSTCRSGEEKFLYLNKERPYISQFPVKW